MSTPWREFKKDKSYPKLDRDLIVDVVIVGGGMAGVLNAYTLSKAGLSVALVEKKGLGSFATMDTTAFITEVIDSDLSEVVDLYGSPAAKLIWQSGFAAINEFEKIIEKEEIDCEFKKVSNFVFASTTKQFLRLEEDYEWYKKFRLPAALHDNANFLNFENEGALEVFQQAKFHPSKFLFALADLAEGYGAEIFENSEAISIEGDKVITVTTKGSKIQAKDVIIATYKPFLNSKTHLKKAMYRSYVFEVEVPKGLFTEALYEDLSKPYYYFRIDSQDGKEFDRMIIGGEDHKDIFGDKLVKKSFSALDEYLAKLMGTHRYWIVKKWNGPILEPSDGLALIGKIKPHYYVATGFSGNGMTYSMISALLIRDLISKHRNPWARIYDPTRTIFHPKRLGTKARDYIEEFIDGALENLLK